mgnify:CR=1 FL=1
MTCEAWQGATVIVCSQCEGVRGGVRTEALHKDLKLGVGDLAALELGDLGLTSQHQEQAACECLVSCDLFGEGSCLTRHNPFHKVLPHSHDCLHIISTIFKVDLEARQSIGFNLLDILITHSGHRTGHTTQDSRRHATAQVHARV